MRRMTFAALAAAAALLCLSTPARATVTTVCSPATYTGNSSTRAFTFPCRFLAASDLVVTVAGTAKALGSDYTVTGAGGTSGTVTFTTPPGSSTTVVITRHVDLLQNLALRGSRTLNTGSIEDEFDKTAMGLQQIDATHTADKLAQATKDSAQDAATAAILSAVAALNGTSHSATDTSSVLAFGSTIPRTLTARFADVTNIADYATCNGVTDDTSGLALAISKLPASSGTLVFPTGCTLRVSDQNTISKPYTRVEGNGAKIVQTGTLKRGLTANAPGVVIQNLWLYNNNGNTEYADAPAGSNNAIGIYFDTGCDGCKALYNRVEQWAWSGIRVYQSKYVLVAGNEVIGIGATKPLTAGQNNNLGIELYLSGLGYPGTRVLHNNVHDLAQGYYMGFDWQDVVFDDNSATNIQGQHGFYLGSAVGLVVSHNTVTTTGQNCIKIQISTDTTLNSENNVFSNNTMSGCGAAGLIALPSQAGLTPRFKGLAFSNNTARNTTGPTYSVDQADDYNVTGNIGTGAGTFGLQLGTSNGSGRVGENIFASLQQTGIYSRSTSTAFLGIIERNYILDPALSGTGTSDLRAGIFLSTGEWIARDNVITATTPSLVGSSINVNGAATVTLQRNRTFLNKANVMSGTLLIDGLVQIGTSAGATLVADAQATRQYVVTCSVATTAWTHGAPINPTSDAAITYTVKNTSAGALGTLAWNAIFKMAAWTQPGAATSRSITFRFDGTNWVEVSRTPADVAN